MRILEDFYSKEYEHDENEDIEDIMENAHMIQMKMEEVKKIMMSRDPRQLERAKLLFKVCAHMSRIGMEHIAEIEDMIRRSSP